MLLAVAGSDCLSTNASVETRYTSVDTGFHALFKTQRWHHCVVKGMCNAADMQLRTRTR